MISTYLNMIQNLPNEILYVILKYLQFKDLTNLAMTCYYYYIALTDDIFMKIFDAQIDLTCRGEYLKNIKKNKCHSIIKYSKFCSLSGYLANVDSRRNMFNIILHKYTNAIYDRYITKKKIQIDEPVSYHKIYDPIFSLCIRDKDFCEKIFNDNGIITIGDYGYEDHTYYMIQIFTSLNKDIFEISLRCAHDLDIYRSRIPKCFASLFSGNLITFQFDVRPLNAGIQYFKLYQFVKKLLYHVCHDKINYGENTICKDHDIVRFFTRINLFYNNYLKLIKILSKGDIYTARHMTPNMKFLLCKCYLLEHNEFDMIIPSPDSSLDDYFNNYRETVDYNSDNEHNNPYLRH